MNRPVGNRPQVGNPPHAGWELSCDIGEGWYDGNLAQTMFVYLRGGSFAGPRAVSESDMTIDGGRSQGAERDLRGSRSGSAGNTITLPALTERLHAVSEDKHLRV